MGTLNISLKVMATCVALTAATGLHAQNSQPLSGGTVQVKMIEDTVGNSASGKFVDKTLLETAQPLATCGELSASDSQGKRGARAARLKTARTPCVERIDTEAMAAVETQAHCDIVQIRGKTRSTRNGRSGC